MQYLKLHYGTSLKIVTESSTTESSSTVIIETIEVSKKHLLLSIFQSVVNLPVTKRLFTKSRFFKVHYFLSDMLVLY